MYVAGTTKPVLFTYLQKTFFIYFQILHFLLVTLVYIRMNCGAQKYRNHEHLKFES